MERNFNFRKRFIKDQDNLEMLKKSQELKDLDKEMLPILQKFFLLPMTPIESCYGHPENGKDPYLSYVDDISLDDSVNEMQLFFREKLDELQSRINRRLGGEIVNMNLEKTEHGGGPNDYTIRFRIDDKAIFKERGKEIIDVIWDEFNKYLEESIK
jgi:hypothetical protein